MQEAVAGAAAGVCGTLLGHPLDLLKVRGSSWAGLDHPLETPRR